MSAPEIQVGVWVQTPSGEVGRAIYIVQMTAFVQTEPVSAETLKAYLLSELTKVDPPTPPPGHDDCSLPSPLWEVDLVDELLCKKCGQNAPVSARITDPDQLAKVGIALGLKRPAAPYLILDCPRCGQRVIPLKNAGGRRPTKT